VIERPSYDEPKQIEEINEHRFSENIVPAKTIETQKGIDKFFPKIEKKAIDM